MRIIKLHNHRGSPRCGAYALILVLGGIMVAAIMGTVFLNTTSTSTSMIRVLDNHMQARHIAEGGAMLAIRYIEQTPDWYLKQTSGVWVESYALYGGEVTVRADYDPADAAGEIAIVDMSFAQSTGQLSNPLFNPPMSGTIGGWQVERTAAVKLGATVPRIGVMQSNSATDGTNLAYVTFPLSVIGTAQFSQTLGSALRPDTAYKLRVDVGTAALALLLSDTQIKVYAGGTLVASSADPQLLSLLDLGNDTKEYCINFETGDSPPAGNIRIELYSQSVLGLLSAVAFDNVRLETQPSEPYRLTSTGEFGGARHKISVYFYASPGGGPVKIVKWTES